MVIVQFLHGMIGKKFSFLNYYKEIPVSYDAILLSVENEMAEFAVHEYQANVINMEKKTLIYSHELSSFPEDMIGEAFYVSSTKKRVILCNFGYSHIRSDMRKYVRVLLDHPVEAEFLFEDDIIIGKVKDLSLGGAAITISAADVLVPGLAVKMLLILPEINGSSNREVGLDATVVSVIGTNAPYNCIVEFSPEKHSQQEIAYFINQRQVEIIKELKNINV